MPGELLLLSNQKGVECEDRGGLGLLILLVT